MKTNKKESNKVEATEVNEIESKAIEATISGVPEFGNLEWLKKSNPSNYHTTANVSTKFDIERESDIVMGIDEIKKLYPTVNELVLLLGLWWEVKPARAGIKKLIDEEAKSVGFAPDMYLQDELKKQILPIRALCAASDRIAYAITYFKPRTGLSNKVPTVQVRIEGKLWELPKSVYETLKNEYAGKPELKAELREKVIASSKEVEEVEIPQL